MDIYDEETATDMKKGESPMPMTPEEFKAKLSSILGADNPGVISEVLVELESNNNDLLTTVSNLTAQNAKLSADNADLIKANGNLFMQVGVQGKNQEAASEADDDEEVKSVEEVLEAMLDKRGNFKED